MSEELNIVNQEVEDKPCISTLTPQQQRFVHLYLSGEYKIPQLAELIGVHPNTANSWLRRADIKQIIHDFQIDEHEIVESHLKALRTKAIVTMQELMDSPIDGIKYQASKDILDRTGHKAIQQMKIDKTVITIEQKMKELASSYISEDDIINITLEEDNE